MALAAHLGVFFPNLSCDERRINHLKYITHGAAIDGERPAPNAEITHGDAPNAHHAIEGVMDRLRHVQR